MLTRVATHTDRYISAKAGLHMAAVPGIELVKLLAKCLSHTENGFDLLVYVKSCVDACSASKSGSQQLMHG